MTELGVVRHLVGRDRQPGPGGGGAGENGVVPITPREGAAQPGHKRLRTAATICSDGMSK